MGGVSDDRAAGFSSDRWLFGGRIVGLLVVLFVPLLLSFLAMPSLSCFLRVTPIAHMYNIMPKYLVCSELLCT